MHDFGNSENPESHRYRRPGQVSPNPFEHTSFSDFDAAKPGNGFRHTNSSCFAPFSSDIVTRNKKVNHLLKGQCGKNG